MFFGVLTMKFTQFILGTLICSFNVSLDASKYTGYKINVPQKTTNKQLTKLSNSYGYYKY